MPDDVAREILAELRAARDELGRELAAVRGEVETLRAIVNRGRAKYSVAQACDRLGVGRSTLYRKVEAGELETVREGGRVFVTERACADYEDRVRSDRQRSARP